MSTKPKLGDFYRAGERVTKTELANIKLLQAEALSFLLYGEVGDSFRNLNCFDYLGHRMVAVLLFVRCG